MARQRTRRNHSRLLPHFTKALHALGQRDIDRARALGITPRWYAEIKAGRLPQSITRMLRPALLRALLRDLRATPDLVSIIENEK